jgi:UDP-glucuronate decarboxylase
MPQDDPKRRRPDIRLAGAKLNWCPAVALEKGLAATIAYFSTEV